MNALQKKYDEELEASAKMQKKSMQLNLGMHKLD